MDEEGTRRIESILATNTVARADVEVLAQTYELLDDLPRPQAPVDFAEKTVATAKLDGYRKPLEQQAWYRTARRIVILACWCAMMVVSATFGYFITNRWVPIEEDVLIEDLQMIKNLDVYSDVNYSVPFLDQLTAQRELLDEIRKGAGRESK